MEKLRDSIKVYVDEGEIQVLDMTSKGGKMQLVRNSAYNAPVGADRNLSYLQYLDGECAVQNEVPIMTKELTALSYQLEWFLALMRELNGRELRAIQRIPEDLVYEIHNMFLNPEAGALQFSEAPLPEPTYVLPYPKGCGIPVVTKIPENESSVAKDYRLFRMEHYLEEVGCPFRRYTTVPKIPKDASLTDDTMERIKFLESHGLEWLWDVQGNGVYSSGFKVPARPLHLDEIWERYVRSHPLAEVQSIMERSKYSGLDDDPTLSEDQKFHAKVKKCELLRHFLKNREDVVSYIFCFLLS
jgi:hypothetical protein